MKALEERILKDGKILEGNILKVDSFLNHQIDPELFMEMAKDFIDHFKNKKITKILTVEVSGIAIAFAIAAYLKVPFVFAKKTVSLTLGDNVYTSKVVSYTKNKEYDIKVDKSFLQKGDKVLIVDDFLATGQALNGLIEICDKAGAEVVGIAIAIEKVFQNGGNKLREKGYDVYSQAMIEKFSDGKLYFKNRDC